MPSSYEGYLELLGEFESLPKKIHSESIFDIAGYPHYENVASNILAFFLNPNNEHGLGQLMLSSLLNLAAASETNQSNVQVSREAYTINGGRLDILIETDNQLIGVENKIYHHLANDLEGYSKSLDKWAQPNQLNVVKIVLGIRREQGSYGFIGITYEELFSKVKERLGSYASTSSQKWLLYLLDFMSSVERLKGDDVEFDGNDKFFIENEDRVNSLVNARNRFLSKLNCKVRELQGEIEKPVACEKQWIYAKSCLVHDFNLSGNSIAFDLHVSPTGWELQLFGRTIKSQTYLTELFTVAPMSNHVAPIKDSRYILQKFGLDVEMSIIKEKLLDWFNLLLESEQNKNADNTLQRTE
ncbi:MAG TPA: PD-(D/E)XK nuclease family protein [Azoarcus taiwanensis]|nr:PD-(D/E)XK nuclease family protein [Azoarcus taiwanensis]